MQGVQGGLRWARTPYPGAFTACEPEKKRRCGILSTSYANSRRTATLPLRCMFAIPIGKSHKELRRFLLVLNSDTVGPSLECDLKSSKSDSDAGLAAHIS